MDDLADQRHLGLVHHAQKHAGLPAGVHTLGGEEGRGVVEPVDQLLRNLLGELVMISKQMASRPDFISRSPTVVDMKV